LAVPSQIHTNPLWYVVKGAMVPPAPFNDAAVVELECALEAALEQLAPAHAGLARGSVKRRRGNGGGGGGDLESCAAAKVFWASRIGVDLARAAPAPRSHPEGPGKGDDAVVGVEEEMRCELVSIHGLRRHITRNELAHLIVDAVADALPAAGASGGGGSGGGGVGSLADHTAALRLVGICVAPGMSGAIRATTAEWRDSMASSGRVACAQCGRFVAVKTGGLEWHLKAVHGVTVHAEAAAAAAAAATALVPFQPLAGSSSVSRAVRKGCGATAPASAGEAVAGRTANRGQALVQHVSDGCGSGGGSAPATARAATARAATARAATARAARPGAKALAPGLAACRSGDLRRVIELVEGPAAAAAAAAAAGSALDAGAGAEGSGSAQWRLWQGGVLWDPRSSCDEHGSGPLLWAAGGGHLDVCR